jgi:GntR family transcriptional regulator/MocR family aminotransferase
VIFKNDHFSWNQDDHYNTPMDKIATALVPLISVDRHADRPLHRQIYDAFRAAILRGDLRSAQQVPSTRVLARELGVSRIPVVGAYEELLSEGYFESRTGSGTFVSRSLPEKLTLCEPGAASSPAMQSRTRSGSQRSDALAPIDNAPWLLAKGAFSVGQLAYEHFPIQVWSRLLARQARNLRTTSLQYGPAGGRMDLRETLANYLRSARGVRCEPEQIFVVSGSQQALQIAALALLDPGDKVWMEEPGYWLAQRVFALAGARLVPVPVDAEGMNVAAGVALARKARLAFVTPSHQFPLGATMSLPRRLQLIDWARSNDAWVIEDDYDSEYRYQSRPIASLQGLDPEARVIYIGTFSKVLFPSLRIGYMVVPPDLLSRFLSVRQTIDVTQSDLHQAVLNEFINEGHFARHIRRTRMLYAERRSVLEECVLKNFGDEFEIMGDQSGMHLTVAAREPMDDRAIALRAAERKLWLWPLSPYYLGPQPRQGFLLGFAGVATEDIPRAVRQFLQVMREG